VPKELQCGPVSFSPSLDKMVATEIVYDKDGRVCVDDGRDLSLRTRLVYSDMSAGHKRFTKFRPLFNQEADASYAHPFLYNDGRSVLFTSNMSGGHGGFDLYVAHWNEERGEWGYPVNLGPTVNSEGDEIFPVLFEGELYFSSNGHLGLGGYDLFRVLHAGDEVVPNSLYHLPYPVNTIFNDFHVYPLGGGAGYIASDRGRDKKDNLFYYNESGNKGPVDLDLTEQSRLNGNVSPEQVTLGGDLDKPLLSTVYFDFDKADLTPEAARDLRQLIRKHGVSIEGLHVVGYADEMGEDAYNRRLSLRRARAVADWLHLHGLYVPISVEGRGKLVLQENRSGRSRDGSKVLDLIKSNRRARRAEIHVEK
jgi:outer membrane protein OmpA-like peptidoglycan-associated protein